MRFILGFYCRNRNIDKFSYITIQLNIKQIVVIKQKTDPFILDFKNDASFCDQTNYLTLRRI